MVTLREIRNSVNRNFSEKIKIDETDNSFKMNEKEYDLKEVFEIIKKELEKCSTFAINVVGKEFLIDIILKRIYLNHFNLKEREK